MAYVVLVAVWMFDLWCTGRLTDVLCHAYNFPQFPGATSILFPGLLITWSMFVAITITLFKLGRKFYFEDRNQATAETTVPVQENK